MLRRHPVLSFFLLAIGLSWAGWIPIALAHMGRLPCTVPAELLCLTQYAPTFAAFVLTFIELGRPGARELFQRALRWRVSPRWYLVVLLISPALALAVCGGTLVFERSSHDWPTLVDWQSDFIERIRDLGPSVGPISGLIAFMKRGLLHTFAVFAGLAITNGGVSEEFGWRGYLLPRLQSRSNALRASLLVGTLWALWHTGPGFWEGVFTSDRRTIFPFVASYLLGYLKLTLPLAVLYGWVYKSSNGSLLLSILFHASYNMTMLGVTSLWPDFPFPWFFALLWVAAAAAGWRLRREREPHLEIRGPELIEPSRGRIGSPS